MVACQEELIQSRPDIEELTREEGKEALEEAPPLAWRRIPWRMFKKCGLSMCERVEAVHRAKGWHIKY